MTHGEKVARDARIFRRDNFTCQYCGYKGDTFEKWRYLAVDHFKPVSRGGNGADDNLKTACMDCNFMKSDLELGSVEEARAAIQQWIKEERDDFNRFFSNGL